MLPLPEVMKQNLITLALVLIQPGWPDKHLGSVGRFSLKDWPNNCAWCPIEGNGCGQHRQSPIDLQRDRADPNSPNWKECEDWHWYDVALLMESISRSNDWLAD